MNLVVTVNEGVSVAEDDSAQVERNLERKVHELLEKVNWKDLLYIAGSFASLIGLLIGLASLMK